MLKILNQISSKKLFSNRYWQYWYDEYKMPNGKNGEYHYVNSVGSTMIVPVLNDGRIIVTKQFRYLNQKVSIEFPGGGIEEGHSPESNAKKELKEETAYETEALIKIGMFNPFNGITNEICHVFIAKELKIGNQDLDESEDIIVELLEEKEIDSLIGSGELWDGMSLASWTLFKSYQRNRI